MRQKIKIVHQLLIFGIAVLLSSCSEDLYNEELNQNKYSFEKVPFSKLKKDENFNMSFQKSLGMSFIDKIENNYYRSSYDSNYIISDSIAYVVSGENVVSYNFRIEYPSKASSDTIYNLVIENKSAQEPEYFITKNMKVNQILVPVEITNSNNWSRYTMFDCIIFLASPRDFDVYTMEIDWDCVDSAGSNDGNGDSGGGDGNGGLGNGNGGLGNGGLGNGSNGSDNPGGSVLVSPIGGGGSGLNNSQPPQTPCETLNDAMQNPSVNQGIQNLKQKTLLEKESAYKIDRKYNSQTESYTYTTTYIDGDNFNTSIGTGGYTKGNAHNHPSNGQSIPSIGDVFWLMQCQTIIYPASSNGYNIAVCPNPASPNDPSTAIIYAIMVDNLATLTDQMNGIYGANFDSLTDEEKIKLYNKTNDKYGKKYEAVQNSSSGMEQKFLQLNANFGISLYKFDNNTNNWNKLNLINNTVTPQPCE